MARKERKLEMKDMGCHIRQLPIPYDLLLQLLKKQKLSEASGKPPANPPDAVDVSSLNSEIAQLRNVIADVEDEMTWP
jgi:hypothetical protein